MKRYTQIKDLNIEEFKNYYYNHSNKETIKHFNMSKDSFYKFLSKNNFPHIRQGKSHELERTLDKEKFLSYYKDHTLEECSQYFNTSFYILEELIDRWGIEKHSISYNHELGCMKKYGVKHSSELTHIRQKIKNSFTNMPKEKKEERLRKIYSSDGVNSKPNQEFANFLESNNIKYEREFIINNILIEINPSFTHNINIPLRGKYLNKKYHFNKSTNAIQEGYNILIVWDWSKLDKTLECIKKGFVNKKSKINHHIWNQKMKKLIPDHIETKYEFDIYDDGYEVIINK